MGYAISWLAVQTDAPDRLLSRLALSRTGEPDEEYETPVSGGPLKKGWFLVVANDCAHRIVGEQLLADLSNDHDLVACSIEEHVMFSTATLWRSGRKQWSVTHDSSRGIRDLQVSGAPPASLEQHESRCAAQLNAEGGEESEVDYLFDVPLELAKELTGFKHDEVTDCHERPLEALKDDRPKPRPWWKLW
jgi:hypothetical protein